MDRLCLKTADCEYHEYGRRMREQFNNVLDDEGIIGEIFMQLTSLKDITEITSDQIIMQAQIVVAWRVQKEMLDNMRQSKSFDSIRQNKQRQDNVK